MTMKSNLKMSTSSPTEAGGKVVKMTSSKNGKSSNQSADRRSIPVKKKK